MGFLGDIWNAIMTPLYYGISAILVGFHRLFTALGLDPAGGWSWTLSIIGLTVVIRVLLIPLFVRQIKSSRNMQLIQPKVKELQKKYGHDRERLAQETMKLYRETGTNPFASCMPLLLQMPVFLALFQLLNNAAQGTAKGILTSEDARHIRDDAEIFGAKISDSLTGADNVNVVVIAIFLVIAMTATTFVTQRQLMSKNMPPDAMTGPYAQQQKLLLYVLPVVFAVSGIAFPVGLMIYWTTSNLWTMGQQFYVIRNNPAPGTPAAEAKAARDKAKAERKGIAPAAVPGDTVVEPESTTERRPAVRQQPKKQTRQQRRGGRPSGGTNRSGKKQ